jgi:hypothetical protein
MALLHAATETKKVANYALSVRLRDSDTSRRFQVFRGHDAS